MASILQLGLLGVVTVVAYRLICAIVLRIRNASKANSLGCKAAPELSSVDPFGIKNMLDLSKANDDGALLQYFQSRWDRVSQNEGRTVLTFDTHLFRQHFYMTCDPKNIQAILATQFKDFALGPNRFGTFSPLLGNGIFSADHERWTHSRSLLRPQFTRDQVSDLDLEENHLQNLLKSLPLDSDGWTAETDLLPLFFRLTMDSATDFLFGESVDTQLAALPSYTSATRGRNGVTDLDFVKAFEDSQDAISKASRLQDFYHWGLTKRYYTDAKICHQYIDYFVQKALDNTVGKHNKQQTDKKDRYCFLEALSEATQDPVEIRDQLLSILVAGRDTTASLLSFLFQQFALHPHVFNKLRGEILSTFGTYAAPKDITFVRLKSCHYLQWCLNEALRVFPTVPINSRRSTVDTTLPRGGGLSGDDPLFVPKDTEVLYSVYVMHHEKSLWGEDAEVFNPERWSGRRTGFEYLPFNGGPRICLGQQFALTEAGYVTARLLQRFDKIDAEGVLRRPRKWNLTLTGRPSHGVHLKFHVAQN